MPLNSGAGQGTIIGLFLFCVMFNGAGPKPATEQVGVVISETRESRNPIKKGKKKWVDDLNQLELVEQMKLVGYQLRSDLKTISNTQYIVKEPGRECG